MTISSKTYFKSVRGVPAKQWPPLLREAHDLIIAHTDNGKDWSALKWDKGFKALCDATFEKWEAYFEKNAPSSLEGVPPEESKLPFKKYATEMRYIYQFDNMFRREIFKRLLGKYIDELQSDIKSGKIKSNTEISKTVNKVQVFCVKFYNSMESESAKFYIEKDGIEYEIKKAIDKYEAGYFEIGANKNEDQLKSLLPLEGITKKDTEKVTASVEITPKELKYVRQYLSFNKSVLLKSELEKFIDALQKDIKDQHISKHSKAASAIIAMQDHAVNEYNKMRLSFVFEIPQPLLGKLNKVLDASITDTYTDRTRKVPLSGLSAPTDTTPTADSNTLTATVTPPTEKNETPAPAKVMNSVDFLNLSFKRLGFQPPWLNFIGDPSPGFTMMVYGRPKFGKSYLCLDFAGYLARHHGRVLYVAKEEKLDRTLQDKIVDKSVAHPNLVVADAIPEALSSYEFIFLDSINKLGLSPQDLERLKTQNKGKSFVYIFQVNKAGAFKGSNTFQHDVDVVVELPEIGKAVQYGRFNQGGELNVFPEHKAEIQAEVNAAEPSLYGTLEGIKKKAADSETDYADEFRALKQLHEENIGRKITDKAFNELMEQAIAKTPGFLKQAKELQENYMNYIRYMDRLSSE